MLNCETSFLEINFISIQRISSPWGVNCETNFIEINFISIWISTVKPASLKSISYLLEICRRPGKEWMYVCSYVCARACVCVCVSVYVGGKGCFMGRGSYLLHIPHIVCVYIYIFTYIYIHAYTPFTPPVVRMSGEKALTRNGTVDFQGQFN